MIAPIADPNEKDSGESPARVCGVSRWFDSTICVQKEGGTMAKGDLFRVRQSVFVQTSNTPIEDTYGYHCSYTRYPFREVTRYEVPVRGRAIRKNWATLPDSMRVHNPSSELVALANEAISMEPKPGKIRQEVTNFITSLEKMKNHHFPHGSEVAMLLPGSRWPFYLTVRSEAEARKLGEKALSIGATPIVS